MFSHFRLKEKFSTLIPSITSIPNKSNQPHKSVVLPYSGMEKTTLAYSNSFSVGLQRCCCTAYISQVTEFVGRCQAPTFSQCISVQGQICDHIFRADLKQCPYSMHNKCSHLQRYRTLQHTCSCDDKIFQILDKCYKAMFVLSYASISQRCFPIVVIPTKSPSLTRTLLF